MILERVYGEVVAEYPAAVKTLRTRVELRGTPIEEWLIDQDRPLAIDNVALQDGMGSVRDILDRFDIRSILLVPVISKGRMIGSFSLDAIGHLRQFTADEKQLSELFVTHVTVAIENAQLFGRLQALSKTGQALTSMVDRNELLNSILNNARSVLPGAQRGSVHLFDEQAQRLQLEVYTHQYPYTAVTALSLKPGEGIAGSVFESGEPLVVNDARLDPRYKPIDHPEVPLHRAMICVPLRLKEQVIGSLCLSNIDLAGVFHEDDLTVLSAFADQATIAIENAKLIRKAQAGQAYLQSLFEASNQIVCMQNHQKYCKQSLKQLAVPRARTRRWPSCLMRKRTLGFPWKAVWIVRLILPLPSGAMGFLSVYFEQVSLTSCLTAILLTNPFL